METTNFVKADLHIHTPASSDYKGTKTDEEYFELIKSAKNKDLKVIAITDHNTIEGYKKIQSLKDDLIKDKSRYETLTDSEQARKKLLQIDDNLSIFENLLILPGIEFEVNNNIHLLIIFDENTPSVVIEKFLADGGYDNNLYGIEEPTKLSKWSILDFLEESRKYDCIVIDPHTDSTKGIWDTLPKGTLRANCLRSDSLTGVCYTNEKQKTDIENVVNTANEYKRNKPLAFLKFSDAHSIDEIAKNKIWIKLEQIKFQNIKDAFTNPAENITLEEPKISEILNKLIAKENAFGIDTLYGDNLIDAKRIICALNNTSGGYCLFGLTKDKIKTGLILNKDDKKRKDEINDYIKTIFRLFQELDMKTLEFKFPAVYPITDNKIIISLYINIGEEIISVKDDGRIYLVDKNKIKTASAGEISNLIEERQIKSIEGKLHKKLTEIEKECSLIKNYFRAIPIVKKFEQKSIYMTSVIHDFIYKNNEICDNNDIGEIRKLTKDSKNGHGKGNVALCDFTKPRLDDAYLRISIPVINLPSQRQSNNEEIIFLFPGGATFYSYQNHLIFTDEYNTITAFVSKNKDYSNKFIACFLKSSLMLWYCYTKFETFDFYKSTVRNEIRIPKINLKNEQIKKTISLIENKLDFIIQAESDFLDIFNSKFINSTSSHNDDETRKMIESYNKNMDKHFYDIDKCIYSLLNLEAQEIEIIEKTLTDNGIYVPKNEFECTDVK